MSTPSFWAAENAGIIDTVEILGAAAYALVERQLPFRKFRKIHFDPVNLSQFSCRKIWVHF